MQQLPGGFRPARLLSETNPVLRRILGLLFAASLVLTANVAQAQTNYPATIVLEVRDENGNIITAGVFVGDPMNIFSTGWQAGATITFTFFSDPIHLGTRVANASGEVRATFPVPDVEPGMHTLRLTGIGANGFDRTVDYPIRVLARGTQVGGVTQDRPAAASGGGAFGRTGLDNVADIVGVGFALFAVGAVLVLAVRRSRDGAVPAAR